jgi:hypothetical protein
VGFYIKIRWLGHIVSDNCIFLKICYANGYDNDIVREMYFY